MRKAPTHGGVHLSDQKPTGPRPCSLVTLDNFADRTVLHRRQINSSVCPINFRRYGICLPRFLRVTGNQGSIPEREPEKRLPLPRKAAGAQITHSRRGEVVTKITMQDSNEALTSVLFCWFSEREVMIKRDGRGHSYCAARGEILGSAQDEQLRKHLPRMFSLIKSESQRCSGPHARYTDRISVCSPWPKGLGNPLNPGRARDRELQLFPLNEEFPVSVGEPAEGSLSKRTEAPARVAAASPGNRPPLALVEVKTRPLRRSTRHKSFTGDTLSIDVLNANCGLGLIPGPRPPQGRLKSNLGAPVARANAESDGDLCLRRPVEVSKGPARDRRARRRRIDLEEVSSFRQVAAIDRERRRSSARVTSLTFRPEVGRDYPLNLSILLSGGKETNEDSLSNGE
ncbi:unnamed protein product [Clavelina lepadiformis]|uniref:Uncharacterized protein n=3 Tax=Clavelina lepadiformis TaxID=159417 RepID=A0ABP0FDP1_CLALP